MEIKYEITRKSEQILSVKFIGDEYSEGSPYPMNLFFTLNIDLINVEKLELNQLLVLDNVLVEEYRKGTYKTFDVDLNLVKEGVFDEVLSSFGDDELIRYFNEADKTQENNLSSKYSYMTSDSIGISVSVPHALGDHFEMEMKLKDLVQKMKEETNRLETQH